jgi:hypothetical protein
MATRLTWWLPVATGIAGAAAAMLWLRVSEPRFTADMVVAPLADRGMAGMGTRLPSAEPEGGQAQPLSQDEMLSDFGRFLALLRASPVAEALAEDPAVLHGAFAPMWDGRQQRWQEPPGFGPALRRMLARFSGQPGWRLPDADLLARHLAREVEIARIGETALRRITYRHSDREFAISLLSRLHRLADGRLRAEAARRTAVQVAHIRGRLEGVTQAEHRRALTELLAGYERVLLLLEVDLPFAVDVIEPPHAGTVPDGPDPAVIVPLAASAGLVFGSFVLFAWAGTSRPDPPGDSA